MVLEASVKYAVVGECAEEEVKGRCAELREDKQRCYLPINIVARPSRRRVGEGGVGGQQPGIGLVQNEGIEKLEGDIHWRWRAAIRMSDDSSRIPEGMVRRSSGKY